MDDVTDTQTQSWKQGCRAVFAGFVATAHQRGLPASIDIFWLTEQRDTITASLRDLQQGSAMERDPEALLKRTLYRLLLEAANDLTKLEENDDLERAVRWKELEWSLTAKGRRLFRVIMPHKSTAPQTLGIASKDRWNA